MRDQHSAPRPPSTSPGTPGSPAPSERPSLDGLAEKWSSQWAEQNVFAFDRSRPREEVFAIDTPPPTVSGDLHIGHVFSYAHTDVVARFQRMRGRSVFYPMGWDDNGLPTERRVQNHYGVRCDPALPYDPEFLPPDGPVKSGTRQQPVSRRNFIELCEGLTLRDEQAFERLWRRLGLSVDWSLSYRTIGADARATAQRAFLRQLARGEAYLSEAPTLWDTTFRTAVAQAELEDRERPGTFHDLAFRGPDGGTLTISTTRPELLPACVALVAHPDDTRYRELFGRTAISPLFGVEIPVLAHRLADPEKGTGIAMVCTFGDTTDAIWWRELDLPTRTVIGPDGRFTAEPPAGLESEAARETYARLAGATAFTARERTVAMLRESGELLGEPRPMTHSVKFYEKGDKPLELVTSRQWYLRNGGRDEALRAELLARGRELSWHPEYMRTRYENWVTGLNGDWLISRQRFFGVPLPVWYPLDGAGERDHSRPIVPAESALPVDPSSDTPPGFTEAQRDVPGGFTAETDIMDTWATSSLTPEIVGGWERDPELWALVHPMHLRPQAHEIIRTWLFATMLRSHALHGELPWRHAAISGWILDPDRKKMSKSKGNAAKADSPEALLQRFGPDALRYWAASARPGADTALSPAQMKVGRRLATKVLNAGRFVHELGGGSELGDAAVTEALDRAMLARLAEVVESATSALEDFDSARALERIESFFWTFCDDYLELVKERAYGDGAAETSAPRDSARAALRLALDVQLRLLAPFLPFAAEEVWSWSASSPATPASPARSATPASIHLAPWPAATELRAAAPVPADSALLATASELIGAVRRAKAEAQLSMRAPLRSAVLSGTAEALDAVRGFLPDLRATGRIEELELLPSPEAAALRIEVRA